MGRALAIVCVLGMRRPQGYIFHNSCLGRVLFSGPVVWQGVCFDPGLIPRVASVKKRNSRMFHCLDFGPTDTCQAPGVKPYAAGPLVPVLPTIIMSIFIKRAQLYKHIGYTQVTVFLEALSLQLLKKKTPTYTSTTTTTHTHTHV